MTRQDGDKANALRVLEFPADALREQAGRQRAALEAEAAALRERAAKAEAEFGHLA